MRAPRARANHEPSWSAQQKPPAARTSYVAGSWRRMTASTGPGGPDARPSPRRWKAGHIAAAVQWFVGERLLKKTAHTAWEDAQG
jgi:hypothetical protein